MPSMPALLADLTLDPTEQTTNHSKPHGFMSLPGELHNYIYTYIIPSVPSKIDLSTDQRPDRPLTSPARPCRPFLKSLTGLAYTNKQIYTELMPLLVEQTTFVLHSSIDATRLAAFLTTLPAGARRCVRQLAFPRFTEQVEGARLSGIALNFLGSCEALETLCVTLSSASLLAGSVAPVVGMGRTMSMGEIGMHAFGNIGVSFSVANERSVHVNEDIYVEQLAEKWGLGVLDRLPKLGKLRTECEIGPGHAYLVDAFMDLAEWVVVRLSAGGAKVVKKIVVEFTGPQGQCDLIVFIITVRMN